MCAVPDTDMYSVCVAGGGAAVNLSGEPMASALCNECFILKGRQGRGPTLVQLWKV